jgi:parallel beta-helix repeat protein
MRKPSPEQDISAAAAGHATSSTGRVLRPSSTDAPPAGASAEPKDGFSHDSIPTRPRRRLRLALLVTLTALANPASAAHVECGDVITTDTTLDSDLGPCPGNGLIVRADNITLDLNGHRIFAANGPEETVGVLLGRVRGVTVRNGTVEGFDAGVAVNGGGGNTVTGITAQNNINDKMEPFPFTPRTPLPPEQAPLMVCDYGDGITTFGSDGNVIEGNRVIGNGPYSGISLVDDSDDNVVRDNLVQDNNVLNRTTNVDGDPVNSLCGGTAGGPGMQRGRTVQDIGIRIEGPGANGNQVVSNDVDNNSLVGISIHSYVCNPLPGATAGQPNTGNVIAKNDVRRTGLETSDLDPIADGIASLAQGPIGRVTCTSPDNTITENRSTDNMRHGISLARTVSGTTVDRNVATGNAVDGVRVDNTAVDNTLTANRGQGNGEHDGHDANERCDNNKWRANRFDTVNQPCVLGPGASGNTPGRNGSTPPGRGGESPAQLDLHNRA